MRHRSADGGRACVVCGKKLNSDGTAVEGPVHRVAGIAMIVVGLVLTACTVIAEVSWWRHPMGAPQIGARYGFFGIVAAGLYLIGHGWYWVRGQSTDFSLFDEIDPL